MLTFSHVTFSYPGEAQPMLKDLSFHIERGEFVSVIGASGCGKSTIFRLASGLLAPESGEIAAGGAPIREQTHWCGYMPQSDLLFPWRTVGDNLRLPLEIRGGMSREEMDEQVMDTLRTVGLADWRDKRPAELSGGMRQRAAFARTLLTGSDLLLLDEPFSALDFLTRVSMREWLLDQWQRSGKTILFITHDVEEALFLSGRILVAADRPITALESVPVPLSGRRTMESLAAPEIQQLKNRLIGLLRKQV
jgi:putative hydroxymethylpyrimidine transport system ATP-binding protein